MYEWWYEPVQHPKRPADKPTAKPADKPPIDKPTDKTNTGVNTGKSADDTRAATDKGTPTAPTLRVVSIKGDVQVRKNGVGDWIDFNEALPLKVGDLISTGPEEEIEFALPDGDTLRMDPMSSIKVGPLLEGKGQRTRAIMDMIAGRVFVRRPPNVNDSSRSSFDVRRNECVTSSRGTEYSVFCDDNEKMMQIHVTEGEVIVTINGESPSMMM